METLVADLMSWILVHPHWAGLFVLVVSMLESLLVVGLFVPGSIVMFGVGTIVAGGSMELLPTLAWAALGALLGDGASYLIGRHYHQRLRVIWPFRRYPLLIARGVDFFHQHGGKSIFMARFVGPVRPLLPAVAGMLDMPARRFFVFDALSAILWAPAYILPGVLFGASLGVAAEIAGHLALLLGILVGLLWFSWWLVRRLNRSLQPHAQAIQLRVLDWSRRRAWLHPLAAALLDPQHPEARGMSVLTLLLVIASWTLLTLLSGNLAPDGWMNSVNLYLFHQLQDLRGPQSDGLMVIISALGTSWVLYSFTALTCGWLLWRGHRRMTLHWLITVTGVAVITLALKIFTAVPRPLLLDGGALGYSFPSGHASQSIAVYGFLAVAIARELRSNWHWVPYSTAVFLVVAISFSRLYLGAHWFTDILGGWSLGLAWVALMGIAYRQHTAERVSPRLFTPVAFAGLLLSAGLYMTGHLERDLALYTPQPAPEITLHREAWLDGQWRRLPVFRDDLTGRHTHPLDIQWLASRQQIEERLTGLGWHRPPAATMLDLLGLFNSDTGLETLPVLPQVHRGESQQILLVRPARKPGQLLTLRLWRSEYRQPDTDQTLWVGNVTFLSVDERFRLLHFLRTDNDYQGPLQEFLPDIAGLTRRVVQRAPLPAGPDPDVWPGDVLLIGGD